MTVSFVDKRRHNEKICGVELSNGAWFKCLDLDGISNLINIQHTNDPLNVSPAKAKKIAKIITINKSKLKEYGLREIVINTLVEFLVNCNGFKTY